MSLSRRFKSQDPFQKHLQKRNTSEDVIDKEIVRYKDERKRRKEDDDEVREAIKRSQLKPKKEYEGPR